jgi:hypothetical protein
LVAEQSLADKRRLRDYLEELIEDEEEYEDEEDGDEV